MRILRETHPDLHKNDPDNVVRFRTAQEAYVVLNDADLRKRYDRKVSPPESVAELFFETETGLEVIDRFLPKAPAEPALGEDVFRKVFIPREDFIRGTTLTCENDGKEVLVTVPPSTLDFVIARVKGCGVSGKNGATNGDLLLAVIAKG